jgi:phage terminase large subunit-like protein
MSEVGWRPLRNMGGKIGADIRKSDRSIVLSSGGSVTVRSADNPDSLRGEGLDFVVLDECAFIQMEAWAEALRPSLSDRRGSAMFISTPKGRNWFWSLFQLGQDVADTDWMSWAFPTSDNPYISDDEIEAAHKLLPELVYQQEYLAMFVDDAGGVFRRVVDSATATQLDEPEDDRQYVAGVDVASKVDFTVVSVFDVEAQRQVYMDRFNRVNYPMLEERLAAVYKRFNLQAMTIEDNSIGQGVIDHLRNKDMTIIPFHTSHTTKQAIIQGLAAAFEHGEIEILNDPVQVAELQAYEGKRLEGGGFRYGAPEGLHDDTVMAMAIAWQGLSKPPPAGEMVDDLDTSIYKSKRTTIWD